MPVGTEMYREQHDHLRALAADLRATFDPAALARDATHARALLSRLGGKLAVHLAMEDRSLYPFLKAQPDRALSRTAWRFQEEMGGIHAAFSAFSARWPNPPAISADPLAFAAEASAVLAALEQRIRREEAELFPLASG